MDELLKAIENCDFVKAKAIVDSNPDLLNRGFEKYHNRTPLLAALSYLQYDMAFYFIESGANINAPDSEGNRSLDGVKDVDVAEKLIKLGADVNLQNNMGFYPIHRWNEPKMDRLLVKYGADPNSRAHLGQTPIHMACLRGEPVERIKGLVELGADIWLRDREGKHIFNYLEDFQSGLEGRTDAGEERAKALEEYFDSIVE